MTRRRDDPLAEMGRERRRARRRGDPHTDVCTLATVDAAGQPEARALSLRQITSEGIGLLINRTSPKWKQISKRRRLCLLIYWSSIHRQYRVRGGLAPMPAEHVEKLWDLKSRGSKLLEHYYSAYRPQSRPIPSRATLLVGIRALGRRFPPRRPVPIPETLAGVMLVPTEIEAWHGSPKDRLHDRRLYRRHGSGWTYQVLVP